jgi:DNA-binding response OmpR family regulator
MNARATISDREIIAQLREENLWLRAELGLLMDEEQLAEAKKWFGLTRSEAKLLNILMNSRLVTYDQAMLGMGEPGRDYEAQEKILDVWVCKLRAKLKKHGAGIKTIWSTGYELDPASRRIIAARLGQPVTPASYASGSGPGQPLVSGSGPGQPR